MNKSLKKMTMLLAILLIALFYLSSSDLQHISNNTTNTIEIKKHDTLVKVPKNPKKVVVMDYGIIDIMNNLNIKTNSIATSTDIIPKYINKFPANEVVNIGNLKKVNLEKIIEYKPDLIIISGRQTLYYDALSRIAPTLNLTCNSTNYLSDLENNIDIIGKIFDKEKESLKQINGLKTEISLINSDPNSSKEGLIVMAFGNKLRAFTPGSRQSGLVYNACNLKTVAITKENKIDNKGLSTLMISPEFIRAADPEYIIVIDRDSALNMSKKKDRSDLFNSVLLKDTKVVRNNKIFYVDSSIWYLANGGITSTKMMLNDIKNAIK